MQVQDSSMPATRVTLRKAVACTSCGARLARDHGGTVCSPCRRTEIERSARANSELARERSQIGATFESTGLYGVAERLKCTPVEALDVLFLARLVPVATARRRKTLRQLVTMSGRSHVDAAAALHISRWTVATYRGQLGISRSDGPAKPV